MPDLIKFTTFLLRNSDPITYCMYASEGTLRLLHINVIADSANTAMSLAYMRMSYRRRHYREKSQQVIIRRVNEVYFQAQEAYVHSFTLF